MAAIDTVIVGAGVAGLACGAALRRAGREVLVLDKARGVGGRCATRRVDGVPVDHGPVFVHGAEPAFVDALAAVPGDSLPWPVRVEGAGRPCHPDSLAPDAPRLAWRDGLTALPRHLATDLAISLGAPVLRVVAEGSVLRVERDGAPALRARDVVFTPPAPQTRALLAGLRDASPALRAVSAVLERVGYTATLSLIARYDAAVPRPTWDLWYPEGSDVLQLVANDATKRGPDAPTTLVLQARAAWSRAHLERAPEAWARALLDEAARLLGAWAASPVETHPHRWRYARADASALLPRPILVVLTHGARVALCGELFDARGGIQGAYCSGIAAARRLLEDR